MSALLLYCRPGFEPDLAAELVERAALAGLSGHARTERDSGWLTFHVAGDPPPARLDAALPFASLVFARQKLHALARVAIAEPRDRLTPLLAALDATLDAQPEDTASRATSGLGRSAARFGDLLVEHPDSDAGRPLAGLARSFGNAMRAALRQRGSLSPQAQAALPRLHVFFASPTDAWLACTTAGETSPWPLGIPRLKLPPGAPSRSTLKLEEALLTLATARERERWLRPGQSAADLGAAPGGWSYVLARHGLRVFAIDNGALAPQVLDTGLVQAVQADGFRWQPPRPLDWLVCDMVEQPRRVARRIGEWFVAGWCRRAIFNLKLPMKQRWKEVRDDLATLEAQVAASGQSLFWRARQLYHDREEITVLAWTDER